MRPRRAVGDWETVAYKGWGGVQGVGCRPLLASGCVHGDEHSVEQFVIQDNQEWGDGMQEWGASVQEWGASVQGVGL